MVQYLEDGARPENGIFLSTLDGRWMDVLVYLSKEHDSDVPLTFAVWDFQIPILQKLTDRGLLSKNWPGIYYRIKDFCYGIPADMT